MKVDRFPGGRHVFRPVSLFTCRYVRRVLAELNS